MYIGDITLGSTVERKFTTRRFTTGAPFALSGGAAVAYVGTNTTEITAGITLTPDFDGRTGYNQIVVTATSGNGFASGTNVSIMLSAGTVDSVPVAGEEVFSFSIENRSVNVARWLGTAVPALVGGRLDASVGAVAAGVYTAAAFATGALNAVWDTLESAITLASSIGLKIKTNLDATVTSRAPATDTSTLLSRIIGTLATGTHQPQSGDSFARLGAPVGASISADLAANAALHRIRSGTCQAGSTASTIVLDSGASALANDLLNTTRVLITGGTGVGQAPRTIYDWTASNQTANVTPDWLITPNNTTQFAVLASASVWDEFVATHVIPNTFGAMQGQMLTSSELLDRLIGPVVTILSDGGNSATSFKTNLPVATNNQYKDAWLFFEPTTTTVELRNQVKRIVSSVATTDFVSMHEAYTAIPQPGDIARLVRS